MCCPTRWGCSEPGNRMKKDTPSACLLVCGIGAAWIPAGHGPRTAGRRICAVQVVSAEANTAAAPAAFRSATARRAAPGAEMANSLPPRVLSRGVHKNNHTGRCGYFYGAADGSRTHLCSLGSCRSTDELQLRYHLLYQRRAGNATRNMTPGLWMFPPIFPPNPTVF